MVDWIEKLLERFEEGEEEEAFLPDWGLELAAPVLPPEPAAGGEAEEGETRSGLEAGAAVRSAETDAWEAPDGLTGPDWIRDGPKRREKAKSEQANGYSEAMNGGFRLNGTAEQQTADGMPGLDRQADEAGKPEAVLDGPAWALGGLKGAPPEMWRRSETGSAGGTDQPDGTAQEGPMNWGAGFEGAPALMELDKAVRAEADSGVDWLYRQAAQAEWPAAPTLGTVQTLVQREAESSPPALTLEELDRAVRRDSRRYDGEMCIY